MGYELRTALRLDMREDKSSNLLFSKETLNVHSPAACLLMYLYNINMKGALQ